MRLSHDIHVFPKVPRPVTCPHTQAPDELLADTGQSSTSERKEKVPRAPLSHLITVPVSADFTGSTLVYRKEVLVGAPKSAA
jgi:hypothetical protein